MLVTVYLLSNGLVCRAQENTWQKTTEWKLYKIDDNKAFRCKPDSLKFIQSVRLDSAALMPFLSSTTVWPKEKYALWMGSYLASFTDSTGKLHKVDISMYGGFFYDERGKTYYQVASGLKKKWLQFINDNFEKIDSL